jgi:hypothetical protein
MDTSSPVADFSTTNTSFSNSYYGNIEDNRSGISERTAPIPQDLLEGIEDSELRVVQEKPTRRSHIAIMKDFDGDKTKYRSFHWQIGLYITANEDFKLEKKMIIFTLSYMMEGRAAW